jgi:hypothetical protein
MRHKGTFTVREALSQTSENRYVEVHKPLIFHYPIAGLCLNKAHVRQSPGLACPVLPLLYMATLQARIWTSPGKKVSRCRTQHAFCRGVPWRRPPTSRAPASDRLSKAVVQRPKPSRAPTVFQEAHGTPWPRKRVLPELLVAEVSHTTHCIAATLYPGMAVGADVPPANPAHRRMHGRDSTAAASQSRAGVVT